MATQRDLIQATLRYLSVRIRSRQEILDYLAKKTTDQSVINKVAQYLEENQLVNDDAFAAAWIESRLKHGKGDKIIIYELRQKGVMAQIIQVQMASIAESSWDEAYNYVVRKYQDKWLHLKGYQQKSKIYQVFQSRGFSSSHIDAFLKRRVE